MTKEIKRKIVNFNFQSDGAHVALVDKAANMTEVLVMKQMEQEPEVQIETSMVEFLYQFLGMYYYEANVLSKLLGYETEMDVEFRDKVTLLKSVEGKDKASEGVVALVQDIQKKFEEGKSKMDQTTIEAAVAKALADQKDAVEAQIAKALGEQEATHKVALEKALEEVAVAKAEVQKKEIEEIATVVKGWSLVAEDEAEAVVQALYKMRSFEGVSVITSLVEKAMKQVEEFATVEKGHAEAGSNEDGSDVQEMIRKSLKELNVKGAK